MHVQFLTERQKLHGLQNCLRLYSLGCVVQCRSWRDILNVSILVSVLCISESLHCRIWCIRSVLRMPFCQRILYPVNCLPKKLTETYVVQRCQSHLVMLQSYDFLNHILMYKLISSQPQSWCINFSVALMTSDYCSARVEHTNRQ